MAAPVTESATGTFAYDVKDLSLADQGKRRTEWAFQSMPALQQIRKQLIKAQPFKDLRIGALIDVNPETANLIIALRDGGATLTVASPNPDIIQDDVAASLARDYSIRMFAIQGEADGLHGHHVESVVGFRPHFVIDHDGELLSRFDTDLSGEDKPFASSEATSWGVRRLRTLGKSHRLPWAVIAVAESQTKLLFADGYGSAQSILSAILRASSVVAGLTVVVAGYGRCGQGVALRLRDLGAQVIVTEVDPVKAVKAVMDGHRVMSMGEAASIGDLFVTITGNKGVIGREHFEKLKNGAMLCSAGHSKVEIDLETLGQLTSSRRAVRNSIEELSLRDGRRIYVVAGGRAVNFVSGEGLPAPTMDLLLANHALSAEYMVKNHGTLAKAVYPVPYEIDCQVGRAKLEAMGLKIDRLSLEQEQYLGSLSEPS